MTMTAAPGREPTLWTGNPFRETRLAASLESSAPPPPSAAEAADRERPQRSFHLHLRDVLGSVVLWTASLGASLLLVSWEDVSLAHPMRREAAVALAASMASDPSSSSSSSTTSPSSPTSSRPAPWGASTVRGMAFGVAERGAFSAAADLEPDAHQNLLSYNEVMLMHRMDRVPQWEEEDDDRIVTRNDVSEAVRSVQRAVLKLQDCKRLANEYEYDSLASALQGPVLRADLEGACYLLQRADRFLSKEARTEIGFDWGSCAWRHCGALADAQEALDELDHLVGVLEPYECLFCLDVVERSLRDILAVTAQYQDDGTVHVPEYRPLQRRSDMIEDAGGEQLDGTDNDYLKALSFLRNTIF
jgi:hypothetical protein